MYQNMTREEMIQRLYDGNFTTGELERQLIAKLFEQCCGGGGSSGGETFVVEIESVGARKKFNKTAKEVFDACKTSNVIFMETTTETDPNYGSATVTYIYGLGAIQHGIFESGALYVFMLINTTTSNMESYVSNGDNDYPTATR